MSRVGATPPEIVVERAAFTLAYGDAVARASPRQSFDTVFPFRRVFAVAHVRDGQR